jgi:hypothetical protein
VVGSTNQRNWRGILIALLVIVAVLALIVTSVVLLTPPDEGPRVKGRRLRIQDLLTDDLVPVRWNGTWISGMLTFLLSYCQCDFDTSLNFLIKLELHDCLNFHL